MSAGLNRNYAALLGLFGGCGRPCPVFSLCPLSAASNFRKFLIPLASNGLRAIHHHPHNTTLSHLCHLFPLSLSCCRPRETHWQAFSVLPSTTHSTCDTSPLLRLFSLRRRESPSSPDMFARSGLRSTRAFAGINVAKVSFCPIALVAGAGLGRNCCWRSGGLDGSIGHCRGGRTSTRPDCASPRRPIDRRKPPCRPTDDASPTLPNSGFSLSLSFCLLFSGQTLTLL